MDLIIEGYPLPGLPEIISAMGVNGADDGFALREGMDVVITDTELWVRATVCHRFGVWCAATVGSFHYVAE